MRELLKKWRATFAVCLIGGVASYGVLQVTEESEKRERATCHAENQGRDAVMLALDAMEEVVHAATANSDAPPLQFSVPDDADQDLKDLVAQINAALAGSGGGGTRFRDKAIEQIEKARDQLNERNCDAI